MSLQLGQSQLAETIRSNRRSENIRREEVDERHRANVANEALTKARDVMNYEEQVRSNIAREEETQRHNYAQESAAYERNDVSFEQNEETRRHNKSTEAQGWLGTAASTVEKAAKLVPLFIS
nr:putative ORF1 [Marmot picobirnavirus]